MTISIFAGPSLSGISAESLREEGLEILPPIQSGDLFRLGPGRGDVVGIIDGLFHQARAITHKEILWAIGQGAIVLGAASMGALRASELHTLGMIGVGHAYEDFADGTLVADDEVAVLHGDEDSAYRSIGFALVDLRASVSWAVADGALSADQGRQIVDTVAETYYPLRTRGLLARVIPDVVDSPESATKALEYLSENWVDLKQQDALKLLDAVRGPAVRGGNVIDPTTFDTVFMRSLEFESSLGEDEAPRSWLVRVCQLLAEDYPEFHIDLVQQLAAREDPYSTDALLTRARHLGLQPADEPISLSVWTSVSERQTLDRAELLRRGLARSFQYSAGSTFDREAERALRNPQLSNRVADIWHSAKALNERAATTRPGFSHWLVPTSHVAELLCQQLAVDPPELGVAASMRGFRDVEDMVNATRPLYLLWKFNPTHASLRLRDFMTAEDGK